MESRITKDAPTEKGLPSHTDVYVCTSCKTVLFDACKKFASGCGFPSFWLHHSGNVKQQPLHTYGRNRIQLVCNTCGAHLGHLFLNKHTPTGIRYCVNESSIQYRAAIVSE
ncbi:MAG TPA: peptide-methionine (R)-S-oxide reductase [Flavisolibacter sp.]